MLVTAHPDDEAMFFTPFIKAILTQRKVGRWRRGRGQQAE
jgi:LmbE family N-acetylglucosaminyl deacetylase